METGPGQPSSLAGSLRGQAGREPRGGRPSFGLQGMSSPLQGQETLRTHCWEPRFTETPTRVNTSPPGALR